MFHLKTLINKHKINLGDLLKNDKNKQNDTKLYVKMRI